MLLSVSICQAQTQPPLSAEERRLILKALIDRDEFAAKVKELEGVVSLSDQQLQLAAERLRLERDQRLSEKKLHLTALKALSEYRTKRRPLLLKILTLSIVRDKHDKLLDAQIVELEKQIMDWR